jgi:hypothetical protein
MKKVNPAMNVLNEVYGPFNKNKSDIILRCNICNEEIEHKNRYRHIKSLSHKEKSGVIDDIEIFKTSLNNRINTVRFYNNKGFKTTIDFFNYHKLNIIKTIDEYLEKLDSIKIKLVLKVEFYKMKTDKNLNNFMNSTYSAVFKSDDIEIKLKSHFNQINSHISDPEIESETGYRLNRIYHSHLYIDQYSLINASSCLDLPKVIKNKKAVINVKNENDNECFKWSVLSALHQVDIHPKRLSKYIEFKDELNFNNIEFPVKLNDYKILKEKMKQYRLMFLNIKFI